MVDNGWLTCGASAEIVAQVVERLQGIRRVEVRRFGFAPVTCPPTPALEELYYPNALTIASGVFAMVRGGKENWIPKERAELKSVEFKGPF